MVITLSEGPCKKNKTNYIASLGTYIWQNLEVILQPKETLEEPAKTGSVTHLSIRFVVALQLALEITQILTLILLDSYFYIIKTF